MAQAFQLYLGQPATAVDDDFYELVSSLEVEENADLPGAFELTLRVGITGDSQDEDLTLVGDKRFEPYARIAVVVSVDGRDDECIFDGCVLAHRIHVDRAAAGSSVRVWGQDVTCLMNLEEKAVVRTGTDGAIANQIFDDHEHDPDDGNLEDDSVDHREDGRIVMQRGTDAQFLRDRARRNGRLFRVACGSEPGVNTGYFIKPSLEAEPDLALVLHPLDQANVNALDFEWDVARPTQVIAMGLGKTKDAIGGEVGDSGLARLDDRMLAAFAGTHRMSAMLTTTADDASDLQQRATSVLREAGWFVRCQGEADIAHLDAVLRVGTVVSIDGAGSLHSGNYYVWSVRHTFIGESHRMRFVLVRNAVGAATEGRPS